MAAENARWRQEPFPTCRRFNEAAANGRGKPRATRSTSRWRFKASMRPRRMAAENRPICAPACRRSTGFNEAAANGRGKPGRRRRPGGWRTMLQ